MRPRQLPRVLRVVGLDLAASLEVEQRRSTVLEVQTCFAAVAQRCSASEHCSAVIAWTGAPIDSLRSGHIVKCAGDLVDGSGTNCTTARRLEAAVL